MNAVLLLMGLLVLSYLGSFLVSGRTMRGAGLPSGVEYVALGFVLGPGALEIVGRETVTAFEPVVQVALGWLAFGRGLDYGFTGERRLRAGSLALGTFSSALSGGAVAAFTWFALGRLHVSLGSTERLLLAGGAGTACSETTRHAVRWVIERHNAKGPLAERLDEISHASDLLPLLALAVLFAMEPVSNFALPHPLHVWPAITVGLGLLLGAGAALLVRSELRLEDTWAVLFGVSLVAIGATARLALSALTACFFMGIATSALSRHRRELRSMVTPTERPVLLPALLLAGARVDFRATPALGWIAAAAIFARVVAKILVGWSLAIGSPSVRKAGPLVGLALLSSGSLAMSIGLVFALRFPGAVGDTVLAVAVLSATVGEFVAPVRLRRALQSAGEIDSTAGPSPAAPTEVSA
ncbi:MAG: potassium transporter Kef [Myxococcota bacterium]|nr:potassium transporter Kef [Myxococcota bacterium]